MLRARSALKEWLELRARLREERQFHLDSAAADFRDQGFSPRQASKQARARFGSHRNVRLALRELGGDLRGLAHLMRAHRVPASAWMQPIVLLSAVVLILLLSPAPRAILEGIAGTPLNSGDRQAVFFSTQGRNPDYTGITSSEFDSLRSLATVTAVERCGTLYARARAAHGASLAAIESEARAKTGNRRLWAAQMSDRSDIMMEPAKAVWLFLALYAVFSLRFGKSRWLLYGFANLGLHALATVMAWGLAVQVHSGTWLNAPAAGLFLLAISFLSMTAMQYRYWRTDLLRRCPVCLDRLVLPLTEGVPDRVLFDPATTESVCARGHGVLVESRWSRRFRPQESPLQTLLHL